MATLFKHFQKQINQTILAQLGNIAAWFVVFKIFFINSKTCLLIRVPSFEEAKTYFRAKEEEKKGYH